MHPIRIAAAFLISFPLLAAASSDRKQIEAVYRQYASAFEMKDYQALENVFAPAYTSVANGRSASHDDALAAVRSQSKKAGAPVRCYFKIGRLTVDGSGATVQLSETARYRLRALDKSLHLFRCARERQDHLVLVEGKWRIDRSRRDEDGARYWVDR
ncbi:MAG: nuclear transport factor 2 family protein, partial [Bryobacteraceae bacterium]